MEQTNFFRDEVVNNCTILAQKNQDDKPKLKAAEKYLLAFQKSPQSWLICCEILSNDSYSKNLYAQVAIFLKQKFQYDFYQLPEAEYKNMAELLIRFLINHSHSSITSQLSLSLVLLYMQTFEYLGDIIEILSKTLFTMTNKEGIAVDIIKLIAEVVGDKKVIVSNKQKEKYVEHLKRDIREKVFNILESLGKNQDLDPAMIYKILDAFQEWFFLSRKDDIIVKNIQNHSCFVLALTSMNNPLLAENARECINCIVKAIKKPEDHPQVFEAVFHYIFDYMNECNSAIKSDIEHVIEYSKLFRAFGIKFARTIITNPNEKLLKFLEYLVDLTSNQKLFIDVLVELEEFWGEFSQTFVKVVKTNQYPNKIDEFKELLKALILISLNRIKMNEEQLEYIENRSQRKKEEEDDEEEEDTIDNDLRELEEKQDERRLSRNILVDVQDIIGFHNTFHILCEFLQEVITRAEKTNTNWENPSWDIIAHIECILYAAKSCIYTKEEEKERPNLTNFFQLIMSIELHGVKLNRTKIELIEYASEKVIVSDEIMSIMFKYLAGNLKHSSTEKYAGAALISLCENWSQFVIKNFESFLSLRNEFNKNDDLIIALAVAIAYDEQSIARERHLAQLCTPFAERIMNHAKNHGPNPSDEVADEIKSDLKKLAMIFSKMPIIELDSNLSQVHPLEPVFQELWPMLKGLFVQYAGHTRILANICGVVKRSMRALGIKFRPFILDYFEIICQIFFQNPLPDFLYAIETSASVFGKDQEMIQPLAKIYEIISSATLEYINNKDMKEHDQLIEDFFGMLYRYFKYLPEAVVSSKTLEINLRLAELAIGIEQPNVEKTLFLFLEVLFKKCSYNPHDGIEKITTEIILEKYGAIYIRKLVAELLEYPEQRLREYILDIILASFIHLKNHTLQWLESAFVEISESILTLPEKQDMIKSLYELDPEDLKKDQQEDQDNDEPGVTERFEEAFDFFLFRCKLNVMRDYKLERA